MEYTKQLYSKTTIKGRIEKLEGIGVNPITIPKGCISNYIPSLLELVQKETKKLLIK